jgi:tRNA threonylcarbamoyladenosine biosynthesis protein TsaB
LKILAFDTATEATAVALCLDGEALEARDDPPPRTRPRHASKLLVLIAELLERGRVSWTDLDRIAVGVGPGTFTGLRIGIATARGLARARAIPLVGVSTLRSLALNAEPVGGVDAVAAVIDARRGEVFASVWSTGAGRPLLAPRALDPVELARELDGLRTGRVLAIGSGAIEFRQVLERSAAEVPENASWLHRVTATNHCRLAPHLRAGDPDQVGPDYLRLPDAEIALRARDSP